MHKGLEAACYPQIQKTSAFHDKSANTAQANTCKGSQLRLRSEIADNFPVILMCTWTSAQM